MKVKFGLFILFFVISILLLGHHPISLNAIDMIKDPQLNPANLTIVGPSYETINDIALAPDPHIAAGVSNIIVVMNRKFALYDKSNPGNLLLQSDFEDWMPGYDNTYNQGLKQDSPCASSLQ